MRRGNRRIANRDRDLSCAMPLRYLHLVTYASAIRFLIAYRTNAATECSSSFLITFARCVSAVLTLTPSAEAASLLDLPSAKSCTISRSRGVSRRLRLAGDGLLCGP